MDKRNRMIQTSIHQSSIDWAAGKGVHNKQFFSVVRGIVEYNRDPQHRGRVMVRVLEDGPEFRISKEKSKEPRRPTFDLGWCSPMFGMAGGAGFGSFTVPPVGSRVFVMYERGDYNQGLYFGGWVANAPKQKRYGATATTLDPPSKEDPDDPGYNEEGTFGMEYDLKFPPKPPPYQGHWMEEQGPEIALELTEMIDHTPDSQLLFKTLKGASLLMKERDEAEELILTDRLGAELRFSSNTTLLEDGVLRRGRASTTQHEPITLDNLSFNSHTMSLLTATRTGIEVENTADSADDSFRLQLHPEHPYIKNPELMDTRMAVELDEGEERVRITYMEGGVEVGAITFDAVSKQLNIQGLAQTKVLSDTEILLEAPKIRVVGDLDVEGSIRQIDSGGKLTFLDSDTTPYGSPTRNFWTHREPNIPWPQHDPAAEEQLNERRWW